MLLTARGEVACVLQRRAIEEAAELFSREDEVIAEGAIDAEVEGGDALFDADVLVGDDLGRGRGSGSAEVSDEIRDGEVGLMTDGRDDRNSRGRDGAGESFVVEAVQIFERTTAAGEQDDVDGRSLLMEPRDGVAEF